jgi:hypothetical protein
MTRSNEYWATQREDFELAIHLTFRTSQEFQDNGERAELVETVGYRNLYEHLWQTYSTPDCKHCRSPEGNADIEKRLKLGPDAAACVS